MRKTTLGLAVLAAALCLAPAPAAAQAKIRIAIWDFDNNVERSWWFRDQLGPALRNQIDTAFSANKTLNDKFSVIEREKLELVMKEQGLSGTGALDPQSAVKLGKLLGVKYILTGAIDKFAINRNSASVGRFGVGGSVVSAETTINLRFIDTTTAERVVSVSADGEVKKGGGFFKGTSLSRDAEWGVASETLEKAASALVAKLVASDTLARIGPGSGPMSGLDGLVAKVDGQRAYINLGSASGVKVGDKFGIFTVSEAIIDPSTGQSLGAAEKNTGTGTVVEVAERFAVIQFTGAAKIKDVVRKQ